MSLPVLLSIYLSIYPSTSHLYLSVCLSVCEAVYLAVHTCVHTYIHAYIHAYLLTYLLAYTAISICFAWHRVYLSVNPSRFIQSKNKVCGIVDAAWGFMIRWGVLGCRVYGSIGLGFDRAEGRSVGVFRAAAQLQLPQS